MVQAIYLSNPRDISRTIDHLLYTANKLLKRSVGSRWWLVRPNGHYHHGTGLGEDAEYK